MDVIDCVQLIQGDALDVMEGLAVDAVITDPPYGVGFQYNEHEDCPDAYPEMMRGVVELTQNALKASDGPAVFWQGMLNADRWHEWFPKGFRLFAACKGFVQFRPTPIQFSWDPVVFFGTPKTEPSVYVKYWHVQNMAPFGAGRDRVQHPCPRPLEQVMYVVNAFTRPGDLVLDPFMGSGTTGIACVRLGRRFIGIEKDEMYFNEAKERIEAEASQLRLL